MKLARAGDSVRRRREENEGRRGGGASETRQPPEAPVFGGQPSVPHALGGQGVGRPKRPQLLRRRVANEIRPACRHQLRKHDCLRMPQQQHLRGRCGAAAGGVSRAQ